jgi:hypothetical protein
MDILRVDTRAQSWEREDVPSAWENTGGRGLIARILHDEIDPKMRPSWARQPPNFRSWTAGGRRSFFMRSNFGWCKKPPHWWRQRSQCRWHNWPCACSSRIESAHYWWSTSRSSLVGFVYRTGHPFVSILRITWLALGSYASAEQLIAQLW